MSWLRRGFEESEAVKKGKAVVPERCKHCGGPIELRQGVIYLHVTSDPFYSGQEITHDAEPRKRLPVTRAIEETEAVKKGKAVHEALEIWVLALPEHDPRIWKGTSNRYRTIARLPEGKSGVEALKDAAPDQYRNIMREVERRAADTYRRMYAEREGNSLTLTQEEWAAFKKAGGESSW